MLFNTGPNQTFDPGNGLARAVHLTTAAVSYGAGLTWAFSGGIRNRPVWWGFFLFSGSGFTFKLNVPVGPGRGACPKLNHH